MGIGAGIFLLAVGAILTFAVDIDTEGLNLNAVGVILMVVGAIGIAASLVFMNDAVATARRRRVVYDDEPVVERRVRERRVVDEY